jgi:hypothetical protein
MRGLSAAEIVAAWEAGERRSPLDRALMLLWAAGEEGDTAALPLAERDRLLLAVRAMTFGDTMACVAACPGCGETLEFDLTIAEIAPALVAPEPETIEHDGTNLAIRPIDSRDLALAPSDPVEAAAFLRARACPGSETLPMEARSAIEARIEAREAEAELSLSLSCAACGTAWREVLDVVRHLWTEVAAAATRVMGEVAEIAAAFGWSEAAILAMSEPRRRGYLALARGR